MKMKRSMKGRRKVREPRFCFKTLSDVDVLDDGYKWRKYGQKVVKNTHHPRYIYFSMHLKIQNSLTSRLINKCIYLLNCTATKNIYIKLKAYACVYLTIITSLGCIPTQILHMFSLSHPISHQVHHHCVLLFLVPLPKKINLFKNMGTISLIIISNQ